MENLKEQIEAIVAKVKADPDFATKFQSNPIQALEEVMGIDLPEDKINELIDAVKAKIKLDDSGILEKLDDSGVLDKLKGFLNK